MRTAPPRRVFPCRRLARAALALAVATVLPAAGLPSAPAAPAARGGVAPQVAPLAAYAKGPYAVGRWDWDFGAVDVEQPLGGGKMPVEHYGTLRYPAGWNGVLASPAQGFPFPVVVYAHGRYQLPPFEGQNHLQADYLLDHLASWGFIVAAVNLDVVGGFATPAGITQRGELIHATISAFEALDPQHLLFDFERTALVGHSRGGEGCLAAWADNPEGHSIRAIATIAPTNFQHYALTDLPYLGLYGSKDGDVNNGWPIQVWDNAQKGDKVFEYIEGCNHFWFTDEITWPDEGDADVSREQQHDVARTYIAEFLLRELGGPAPQPIDELCDGPALWPVTAALAVHPMFRSPGALVVNDFEDAPKDAMTNSIGGLSLGNLLAMQDEEALSQSSKTFFQATNGGWIAHDTHGAALAFYAEQLPVGTDASGFTHLSLRALQRWGAPLNTPDQPQDLRVVLVDGGGRAAIQRLSDYGAIPWPVTYDEATFPRKSVLRTTRFPLAGFLAKRPDLDLTDLRFIGLVLDQTPSSELRIDDLEFTD